MMILSLVSWHANRRGHPASASALTFPSCLGCICTAAQLSPLLSFACKGHTAHQQGTKQVVVHPCDGWHKRSSMTLHGSC